MEKLKVFKEFMEEEIDKKDIVNNLTEDLITVIESYIDELGVEETFYLAISFMTLALHEATDNPKSVLNILKMAMDHGIRSAIEQESD